MIRSWVVGVLLGLCLGCVQVERHDLEVEVRTPRPGVRVYAEDGAYLGRSPVMIKRQAEARHLDEGIVRWLVDGKEVASGGSWPLKLLVYSGGIRKDVLIRVPFDPANPRQVVEARP
ncbi:MAG: hypothetical protein AB7F75_02315 [Planctomycetota bacterium]